MLIADAQIHLWEKGTPSAHHRQEPYSAEQAIAGMDEAGVDGALVHRLTMRTKLWHLFQAIRVLVVQAGPMVRIRLPPAESRQRTSGSGASVDVSSSWVVRSAVIGFGARALLVLANKQSEDFGPKGPADAQLAARNG